MNSFVVLIGVIVDGCITSFAAGLVVVVVGLVVL